MRSILTILTTVFSLAAFLPAAAEAPSVQTSRQGAKKLPLPEDKDSFHFLIYGDRTGGQPEGLKVLSQAVQDTNLLSPDFVMTVGDLINGYTSDVVKWQQQADEYSGIMKDLKMPWFPVAGNHDIYWRGPNRPPGEHEGNFERHFGPLWFWFAHKNCGFIGLYSDEGDASKGGKEFTRPEQSLMSPTQLTWLENSLKEMKSLKQVFVFLHHPRWIEKTYPGTNWAAVHGKLVAAKNVKAVFAGHIHRLHYGGERDGIGYYALAATGASMPGVYPGAGYLHHMNLVTVRPEVGYEMSILPVGQVMDHRLFTPERQDDIELARKVAPDVRSPRLTVGMNGQGGGLVEMEITNPCTQTIEMNLVPDNDASEWFFAPDHIHLVLKPGDTQKVFQTVVRVAEGFKGKLTMPSLKMDTDYLAAEGARVPLPQREFVLSAGLKELPSDFFTTTDNNAAVLNGKSAFRVDMAPTDIPDGPFTVEAWVKPAGKQSAPFLAKTEQSEFSLDLQENMPGFHVLIGERYASAIAENFVVPEDQWTHLAGVFNGTEVVLFINGVQTASVPATGKRRTNTLPLYIGADPDAKSNPTRHFTGALDEVRISSTARYTKTFMPTKRHATDSETLHLYHFDKLLGNFVPSDSKGGRYGTPTGQPKLEAAQK